MSDDLRGQLQTTLGAAYTLDRELGGGGMSRVFVARETALGREVVVKVLAPDLAAGVSAERFAREIAIAWVVQKATATVSRWWNHTVQISARDGRGGWSAPSNVKPHSRMTSP